MPTERPGAGAGASTHRTNDEYATSRGDLQDRLHGEYSPVSRRQNQDQLRARPDPGRLCRSKTRSTQSAMLEPISSWTVRGGPPNIERCFCPKISTHASTRSGIADPCIASGPQASLSGQSSLTAEHCLRQWLHWKVRAHQRLMVFLICAVPF